MHDAVGEENVRLNNLRRVDVFVIAGLADDERLGSCASGILCERRETCAVGEGGRDEDLVGHDVVSHDACKSLGIEVLERTADGGKGTVHGSKYGDVLLIRDLGHKFRGVEAAQEVGHVECLGRVLNA